MAPTSVERGEDFLVCARCPAPRAPRIAGRDLVDPSKVPVSVGNVRRWRDGRMLVRWIAAGLQEVSRSFRRLRGQRDRTALIRALDRTAMDSKKQVA